MFYGHVVINETDGLITRYKTAAICPDFKCSGFINSGHIQNLDHLQTELILTIQNLDASGFQIPIVDHFLFNPKNKFLSPTTQKVNITRMLNERKHDF